MPVYIPEEKNFRIVRIAYVDYVVSNLAASKNHYVDLLGLNISSEDRDTLYLRALEERNHHSIVLREGTTPKVNAIGFKVSCEADLDSIKHQFESLGLPAQFVDRPHQGRTLHARNPMGVPLEFFYSMEQKPRLLQEFQLYKGAHIMRIDHANHLVPHVQQAYDFFAGQLAFRPTEYTENDNGDLWAVWTHRKGNVHDLAIMNGRGPRLHHIGMWVDNALDIIRICDILAASGHVERIERGPGRHGLSNAFFLYLLDPDGHRTELYTADYWTGDPDFEPIRWSINDPRRQTFWGHKAPETWFNNASVFDGVEPQEPQLHDLPAFIAT